MTRSMKRSRWRRTAGCGGTTSTTDTTRLIAEGFHFINGVLYDLHPGRPREESVLVTQTSLFRLTRFYLRGPKAGRDEVVLDGITGLDDGIDRDADGTHLARVVLPSQRAPDVGPRARLDQAVVHAGSGAAADGVAAADRRAGREPGREHSALFGALRRRRAGVCGIGGSVTRWHLSGE